MNKVVYLIFFLLGSIFLTCNSMKDTTMDNKAMEPDKRWSKVDSLEGQGLFRSAWDITQEIYNSAVQRGDYQTQYKALCYQLKYSARVEDGSELDAITELSKVAEEASMPLSSIAHSMTAEAYWTYYQQHRWEILQRTPAPGVEDIRFWDLGRFVDEIDSHFTQSLKAPSTLKSILVRNLADELIQDTANIDLRPSLFEMLAYRALDFYKNQESGLIRPKDFFQIDSDEFYSTGEEFAAMEIPLTDTLSFNYRATRIFQDLMTLQEQGSSAWLATDLDRLQFISSQSSLSNKKGEVEDVHLLKALETAIDSYSDSPILGEYALAKARLFSNAASGYAFGKDQSKKQHYTKAEKICQQIIADYPESRGAQMATNLLSDIRQKSLQLLTEEVLIPNEAGLLKVDYRNLDKLWFRVVSVPHDFMADERYDHEKYVRQLCKQPVVSEWQLDLMEAADHHQHNIETLVPDLAHGHYAVIASEGEDFKNGDAKAYTTFWSTHIAMQEGMHPEGGSNILIKNRDTGIALTGVEIIQYVVNYDRSSRKQVRSEYARYTTDSEGHVHIPFVQNQYNQSLDIKWNGELYHTGFYSRAKQREQRDYESTQFFLDRSIYRPGQTLYLKGIHMKNGEDGPRIMPNTAVEVTLRDANYQEVSKQNFSTNEFGSFNGTFALPSSGLTGQMTLQSKYGSIGFSVEEYKRPKFKVELDSLEGAYRLGEMIRPSGKAIAYNGAPIADAEVRYTVERKPIYRWKWGWWYRMPSYDQSSVQVKVGRAMTDENGKFDLDFEAIAGNDMGGEDFSHYSFEIKVEVTDINGETREANSSVSVGDVGLLLDSNLPQEIDRSEIPRIKVLSTNLNGKEVPASGQWEIRKKKSVDEVKVDRRWEMSEFQGITIDEFRKELPLFHYTKEESMPDPEGELVISGEWNTAVTNTLDKEFFSSLDKGDYIFKLKSGGPEEVETFKEFTVYVKEEGESSFSEALKVIDTSAPYLPGDEAQIIIASSWDDMHVHVELEHDKKIFRKEKLTLDDGQAILRIPIESKHQEGLFIHISALRHNRVFRETRTIEVTPIDRLLDVTLETYRDKMLPGSEEQWKIKVAAQNGDKNISELLLSMYDASLDQFKMHAWNFSPWRTGYATMGMDFRGFGTAYSRLYSPGWHSARSYVTPLNYPSLNRFGYFPQFYSNYGYRGDMLDGVVMSAESNVMRRSRAGGKEEAQRDFDDASADAVTIQEEVSEGEAPPSPPEADKGDPSQDAGPQIRSDFKETAFFFPDLRTDTEGNLIFNFTMPESLTTWKFQALAHSKKLQTGITTQEVITQKQLMVVPNSPRFLRQGDKIKLSSKLVSLSEEAESGSIRLELLNALTMKEISSELIKSDESMSFSLDPKESKAFEWEVEVPDDYSAITYRFIAEGTKHSDGEEDALPVLSNRMLVTEAMPFAILKENQKQFDFERMNEVNESNTVKPHALTLEFTANPIWYAVQAMPYMMEYPYDCSEQIFTRYYANSLASNIINERPRLREVINTWKDFSPDAFLSNLEKNQELKYVILEETPWVMEAQDESERKKRLSLLLDMNHMAQRQKQAMDKLIQTQDASGGWPWFAGMRPNLYITQYILSGLGHLKNLGVLDESDPRVEKMINEALVYLDQEHLERWKRMKRYDSDWKKNDHTGPFEIQYLYARTFYKDKGLPENGAFAYYKEQAAEFWLKKSVYMQGMSALALHRLDNKNKAESIMRSVKEQSTMDPELGMYWKDQRNGWYWYQAGIERHALMVEAFSEIMSDEDAVYGLKQWLIFNKQTNDWETTRATAEACYALLLGGNDWTQDRDWTIEIGDDKFDSKDPTLSTEAGTGYLKRAWQGNEVKPEMSEVKVTKEGEAPAWGAVYYQYFEQLDKITTAESPLKIRKGVFKVSRTDAGEEMVELNDGSQLTVGDRVRIRMEIETDREMEYVHIKDMRSSGMEPVDVLSKMVYSGGLGFYKNTRDAATNFFIDDLRKGAYVLEYDLFVSHKGDFSNGITTIQCMYAPEFTAHSEGIRVTVE